MSDTEHLTSTSNVVDETSPTGPPGDNLFVIESSSAEEDTQQSLLRTSTTGGHIDFARGSFDRSEIDGRENHSNSSHAYGDGSGMDISVISSTARFPQSTIQVPILDPMAVSASVSADYWRDILTPKALWTMKLLLVCFLALTTGLFVQARGDPLAVHLVSSISVLCMLFYLVRSQSRAAHADRVGVIAVCAWISYSAMTTFNGRVVDQFASVYISRDLVLVTILILYSVRYWVMTNTVETLGLTNKPMLAALHGIWTFPSPWAIFTNCSPEYDSHHHAHDVDTNHTNYVALQHHAQPYASSSYMSVGLRSTMMREKNTSDADAKSKRKRSRIHMLHRILGSMVSLAHEILYWTFAVACSLPLHNNSLFVEHAGVTIARCVLFVVVYMILDSAMDPATELASAHVAPYMLIMSCYIFFLSPWMLLAVTVMYFSILLPYILWHVWLSNSPWTRWMTFRQLSAQVYQRVFDASSDPNKKETSVASSTAEDGQFSDEEML